jgi:hypothetical protein
MSNRCSTAVTKREFGADPLPDESRSKPHHLKKNDGTFSMFRNTHPSAGGPDFQEYSPFLKKVFLYVTARQGCLRLDDTR